MLEHLRYFQAVARCGSLSAAARVLQVSQPGLTAMIKQLEETFGTKLLVRLRTGVSLTSTGQELLRFANDSSSEATPTARAPSSPPRTSSWPTAATWTATTKRSALRHRFSHSALRSHPRGHPGSG